ncbi:hypothetical protein [Neptuniibacter sp.]|uniref:hypothetical protein n=1 Tax=Neptuniibacter sp. TaxID=1962643 RepID=UPI00260B56F8|nr:hypothetical protein [Neptuniibacter sp.]MCP4595344.1 hypothetical protein [Neptuniibacter sp.]
MKKTPLLLICIILMPLLVLAWFSARVEEQQQQLVNHQLEALVESQLAKIDQSFQGHFRRLEGALNQEVAKQYAEKDSEYSLPSIRNLTKSSPYIDQVFILNADRETIYPGSGNLTRSERAFINGYKELLDNRDLFHVRNEVSNTAEPSEKYSIPAESSVLAEARQVSKTISAQLRSAPAAPEINISTQKPVQSAPYISSADLAQEPASETFADAENDQIVVSNIESSPSGWIAWYRGAELEQLYWKETPSGEVIGFSLNNAR